MKILSSANEIEKNICAFIEKFDNISMSVAWASANSKAFKVLIEEKNKKKIQSSTVGLHFYQTDSKFIEKFLDDERLQFYTKNKDEGVFHPKIYLFWNNEKDWVCLTGSANFTQSALTKNDEIMTMFDSNDGVKFKEIKDIIDSYYLKSSVMTQEKLNKYIAQSKKNKKETKDNFRLNKSIKDMKWDEYYSLLQEKSNRLEERLKLLTKSCEYFNQNTFENMTELQRKNIAGVLKRGNSIDDWFLFGHMPSQLFANRVSTDDKRGERGVVKSYMKISKALDFIPLTGEVSKKNFDNYIAYFEEYSGWGYSLSTVSRLLAMKRPDQFFCVTGINNKEKKGNFRKLKDTFKINNKIKIYEQYWNEIIEPIRQAPWYKASKPTNEQEFQVWRGRVALMDALLYNN